MNPRLDTNTENAPRDPVQIKFHAAHFNNLGSGLAVSIPFNVRSFNYRGK